MHLLEHSEPVHAHIQSFSVRHKTLFLHAYLCAKGFVPNLQGGLISAYALDYLGNFATSTSQIDALGERRYPKSLLSRVQNLDNRVCDN